MISATVVVKWKTRKGERHCWLLLLLPNRGAHVCITADRFAHSVKGPSWHWMYKRGKQYPCNIWWQPLDSLAWKEKSSMIKKYRVITISRCKERLNQNSKWRWNTIGEWILMACTGKYLYLYREKFPSLLEYRELNEYSACNTGANICVWGDHAWMVTEAKCLNNCWPIICLSINSNFEEVVY